MNAKEKKQLSKIVYDFIEARTKYNSSADGDLVANIACDCFNEIMKKFNIKKELETNIEEDPYTDDEDKEFLLDFINVK